MPPRGRKPKPTRLKQLEGNPGKRRLNAVVEPQFRRSSGRKPESLQGEGAVAWARIAPDLLANDLLTVPDEILLEALCLCYEEFRASGCQKALTNLRHLAAQFGIGPADRSRVNRAPGEEDDPLAAFLGRGGSR